MIGVEIPFNVAKGKFGLLFAQSVNRLRVGLFKYAGQTLAKFLVDIAHQQPTILSVRGALTKIAALPTDTFAGPVLLLLPASRTSITQYLTGRTGINIVPQLRDSDF